VTSYLHTEDAIFKLKKKKKKKKEINVNCIQTLQYLFNARYKYIYFIE
jgi:hypothetical protein